MKKTIIILSIIGLITNITPLLAGTLQIEILPGGYLAETFLYMNFPELPVSVLDRSPEISFSSINDPMNYLKITDQNGNNPFDVTVRSTQFKLEETYSTTVLEGSSGNTLKVASTEGIIINDTINIEGENLTLYTITDKDLLDNQTLTISPALPPTPPVVGASVFSALNCDISPKKCIPLNNFSIKSSTPETIYGEPLNTLDYLNYQSFAGESTTLEGSIGNSLLVVDSSVFQTGEEISLISTDGIPTNYIILEIFLPEHVGDPGVLSLVEANFGNGNDQTPPPIAGQKVRSSTSRDVTLAKSSGTSTSQSIIDPGLKITINGGQKKGKYISTLNFTII